MIFYSLCLFCRVQKGADRCCEFSSESALRCHRCRTIFFLVVSPAFIIWMLSSRVTGSGRRDFSCLDEILIQPLNSTVLAFNKAINTGSPVLHPGIEQMLSNAVINCRLLRPRVCSFKEKSALFSVFTSCIAEKRLIVARSSNRKTLNLASKVFKKSFLRISKHEISGL